MTNQNQNPNTTPDPMVDGLTIQQRINFLAPDLKWRVRAGDLTLEAAEDLQRRS